MGTTENVQAWSKTAATNSTADAGINWAEGQDPATVNNSARGMMAALKKYAEDTGGALVAGGSANALTVTTKQVLSSGHLADGLTLQIEAASDNTSATVTFAPDSLTAANIKRADGSALAIGSIKSGMRLILCYDAGASEWRCANIAPVVLAAASPGLILLTSGTASGSTLDIVLTSYTAYRGIKFVLGGFSPATDDAIFRMQFSTNGGGAYITTGYDYVLIGANASAGLVVCTKADAGGSASVALTLITAGAAVGNGSTEGYNGEVTLLNQTSAAFWSRVTHQGFYINSLGNATTISGGGNLETAQDTDAVRFSFATGNISDGNYAVYGLV